MDKRKKILILGGEGFIGRNIANELAIDFDCYSLGSEKSIFDFSRRDIFLKVNPYENRINDKFDVYVHLIDNQSVSDEEFEKNENKLIQNINFSEGSHLIIFSSAVIYANPNSDYAKRKIKLEKIYEDYCKKNNIKLTIFRLFNIFGKFQLPYKQGSLVANILFNYQNNIPIEIGDRNAKRDFIYAGDMAKFVRWVIQNEFYGKTDLATGKLQTIEELLDVCKKSVFTKKVDIIYKNIPENNVCPIGKNILLEKVELTDFDNALRDTDSFYTQNSTIIKKYLNIK